MKNFADFLHEYQRTVHQNHTNIELKENWFLQLQAHVRDDRQLDDNRTGGKDSIDWKKLFNTTVDKLIPRTRDAAAPNQDKNEFMIDFTKSKIKVAVNVNYDKKQIRTITLLKYSMIPKEQKNRIIRVEEGVYREVEHDYILESEETEIEVIEIDE